MAVAIMVVAIMVVAIMVVAIMVVVAGVGPAAGVIMVVGVTMVVEGRYDEAGIMVVVAAGIMVTVTGTMATWVTATGVVGVDLWVGDGADSYGSGSYCSWPVQRSEPLLLRVRRDTDALCFGLLRAE